MHGPQIRHGFLLIFSMLLGQPAFALDSIGQVVWVKGSLSATQPQQTQRNLTRRSPIFVQDTLVTDEKSTGQIVFTDSSVLALRENTSLALAKYKFGKGTPPKNSTFVANLAKGGFRTITGAVAKDNPDGYQANTPVATIGVAGTGFDFIYNECTEKLSVNCQIGKCNVSNAHGRIDLTKNSPYAVVKSNLAPAAVKSLPAELSTGSPTLVAATFKPGALPQANNSSSSSSPIGTSQQGGSQGSSNDSASGVKELRALNMPCP